MATRFTGLRRPQLGTFQRGAARQLNRLSGLTKQRQINLQLGRLSGTTGSTGG